MRILYYAADKGGRPAYFVKEQIEALQEMDPSLEVQICLCSNKQTLSWISKYKALKQTIAKFHPDIVHAHFGLYGLLANIQRKVPVVTTFHGSDVHSSGMMRSLAKICMRLSAHSIFVSEALQKQAGGNDKISTVIPCGLNLKFFKRIDKTVARKSLGLDSSKHYVLFTSDFNNPVKDPQLAFAVMEYLPQAELLELKNRSRDEVNALLNAVDALLVTSVREGSPQIVKEAIAVGTPIVSVNVGDVALTTVQVANAIVVNNREPQKIAEQLKRAMQMPHSENGVDTLRNLGMDNAQIAEKVILIYKNVIDK